jgi:hypothetical protein
MNQNTPVVPLHVPAGGMQPFVFLMEGFYRQVLKLSAPL